MSQLANLIDGALAAPVSGTYLENFEPATGRVYAQTPRSDAADVGRAITAAERAFPAWSQTSAEARGACLRRLAEAIDAHTDELALAESTDSGKTVRRAREVEIPRAAQNFRFFADAITQFATECHSSGESSLNYTLRAPLGVVACISPWNLPLYLLSWKIAPALAAGNCVVAKPSEVTPMTAYWLAKLSIDCGFPPGALNLVHGLGAEAGHALISDPRIAAVSFTGSTRTGAEIARVTGPRFRKVSLEMGGKNATVVFADCDFDTAIEGALASAYSNQGQICLCGSRILVEQSLYPRFRDALLARVKGLRVGDPRDAATDQGALVSREHFGKVMAALAAARAEGGRFLTGGGAVKLEGRCAEGYFLEPTLVEGLPQDCRTNQEEIFGPVATIAPFGSHPDDEAALMAANATRYGLSASVWTRDLKRAHRFSARLEAGIVWVNCWMVRDLRTPFGGVKDSGFGREGGLDALRFFTEPKNVCVKL